MKEVQLLCPLHSGIHPLVNGKGTPWHLGFMRGSESGARKTLGYWACRVFLKEGGTGEGMGFFF